MLQTSHIVKLNENRLNLEHHTPGEQNKEGGVRKVKSQSIEQREVKCSAMGNYYYYDREKEMYNCPQDFGSIFAITVLSLWPFDNSVKITVLNSPCAMKCFIRPFMLILIESDTSCKSGDTEMSSCSMNKYRKHCLWGLTSISFYLRAVKPQVYALKLYGSFWDFSESK